MVIGHYILKKNWYVGKCKFFISLEIYHLLRRISFARAVLKEFFLSPTCPREGPFSQVTYHCLDAFQDILRHMCSKIVQRWLFMEV